MPTDTKPPRNRMHRLAAMLLAGAAAGCATTPIEQQTAPAFRLPARFAFSGQAPLHKHWWRAFDDPALNSLVQRALTSNFNLQSAYARVEQARASLADQRSDLFPHVDASISQSATYRPDTSNVFSGLGAVGRSADGSAGNTPDSANANRPGSGVVVPGLGGGGLDGLDGLDGNRSHVSTSRSLQFSAGYELDLWGRLRDQAQAAAFDVRSSAAALQSAAISLAGDIASDWYALQEIRARIDLLKAQIETNKNVLDLTTYAFSHGQSQAAAILRQRQTVVSVKGQLVQARADAEVMRHALAILVGQPPESFVAPPGQLADPPPLPDTGVPARLLMRRPDVREQLFSLAAADRRVAAALAARYPQVSLSATLSSSADSGGVLSNWIDRFAANLTQPIFDAGARAAEVRRTRAVVAERVGDYQQTLLEALQETENALTNEHHQKRLLKGLDTQLKLSKKTVTNLRLRYLRGTTDYLDVLDALLTRQDLQVQRLTAQRNLLDFRINLYRALAGGLGDTPLTGRAPPTRTPVDKPAS